MAIYKITNKLNGNCYIGSTSNLNKRKSQHFCTLRKNQNKCGYLQNAWNKYGEENFVFEIIEEIKESKNLIVREQHYFDTLKPKYNIRKIADSCLGVKKSLKDRTEISIRNSKAVLQYNLEGQFIKEWKNAQEVEKFIGVPSKSVSECCRGRIMTSKGFIFKFRDNLITTKPEPKYGNWFYEIKDFTGIHKVLSLRKYCKENNIEYKNINRKFKNNVFCVESIVITRIKIQTI